MESMKPASLGSALLISILFSAGVQAQPERLEGPDEFFAPVTPAHVRLDMRRLPEPVGWQPGDPIQEMPDRKNVPSDYTPPKAAPRPVGEDPLRAIQNSAPRLSGGPSFDTPLINVEGSGFSGVNPPDTIGDVGLFHYVQMINGSSGSGGTRVRVLDKTDGSVITTFNLRDLAVGAGTTCHQGTGDPIILFDQEVDNGPGEDRGRWLMTEFTSTSFCVYISENADFMDGGWFIYQFTSASGGLPDYPKWAAWPDAYYVGANEARRLYAFDRENMLAGATTRPAQVFIPPALSGFGFQMLQPADWDGAEPPPAGSPAYFLRHRDDEAHNPGNNDPNADFIEIWEFELDWDTPANSAITGPFNIAVEEFSSDLCGFFAFACAPQPNSGTTLDPLREPVMWRAQYRNFGSHEVIVGTFVTDVDGNNLHGVRWFELRKSGASPWELFQEGLVSPDNVHRWMSSIAMDGSGNIALGYNVSDATSTFPGLRYIGRLATDPPGTMPRGEVNMISGSSPNASNRYGDYAAMVVDPVDECTFWFTGEYNPASQWSTRIAAFRFDECGEPGFALSTPHAVAEVCTAGGGASFITDIDVISIADFEDPVTLAFDPAPPVGFSGDFDPNPVIPGNSSEATIDVDETAASGPHLLTVLGTAAGVDDRTLELFVTVVEDMLDAPLLTAPPDQETEVALQPVFTWDGEAGEDYRIQVATDAGFGTIVIDETIEDTSFTPVAELDTDTEYFWRVQGVNFCGEGDWSAVFSFTTRLEPLAELVPAEFTFEVPQGGVDSDTLFVTNAGTGTLVWDIHESETAARGDVVLLEEDFEGAFPPAGWDTADNGNVPCPWLRSDDYPLPDLVASSLGAAIDTDDCGESGIPAGSINSELLAPALDLSGVAGTEITFDVAYRHFGSARMDFQVSGDGGVTWDNVETWNTTSTTAAPVTFDLSAYDGLSDVRLRWHFVAGWDWWGFVDNVTVTAESVACDTPTDVPWLSVSPDAGSTPAGETDEAQVMVDAAGLDDGEYEAYLCLTTNAQGQAVIPILVELTVTEVLAGQLAVDPDALPFGGVAVGGDAAASFTVSNAAPAGSLDIELLSIEVTAGEDVFAIIGGDCEGTSVLSPGDECAVDVLFSPGAAGPIAGEVTVSTVEGQSEAVSLSGTGLQDPGELEVTPLALSFGDVAVGGSSTEPVMVSNVAAEGAADLEITQIDVIAGGDVFAVTGGDCGATLAPQSNCTVTVEFSPQAETASSGVLRIVVDGDSANVSLSGSGIEGLPVIFEDRFEQ